MTFRLFGQHRTRADHKSSISFEWSSLNCNKDVNLDQSIMVLIHNNLKTQCPLKHRSDTVIAHTFQEGTTYWAQHIFGIEFVLDTWGVQVYIKTTLPWQWDRRDCSRPYWWPQENPNHRPLEDSGGFLQEHPEVVLGRHSRGSIAAGKDPQAPCCVTMATGVWEASASLMVWLSGTCVPFLSITK